MRINVLVFDAFLSLSAAIATPLTQVWIPSTDIQPFLNPHLDWDEYFNAYGNGYTISNIGLLLGVLPLKKIKLDIGFDWHDFTGHHDHPFLFNAKLGRFSAGGYAGALGHNTAAISVIGFTGKIDRGGVLASWDRRFPETSNKLWAAIDFQSGNSGYGAVNFGASWNFAPNILIILGYDIFLVAQIRPAVNLQLDPDLF